jgi:hypothetical protein
VNYTKVNGPVINATTFADSGPLANGVTFTYVVRSVINGASAAQVESSNSNAPSARAVPLPKPVSAAITGVRGDWVNVATLAGGTTMPVAVGLPTEGVIAGDFVRVQMRQNTAPVGGVTTRALTSAEVAARSAVIDVPHANAPETVAAEISAAVTLAPSSTSTNESSATMTADYRKDTQAPWRQPWAAWSSRTTSTPWRTPSAAPIRGAEPSTTRAG